MASDDGAILVWKSGFKHTFEHICVARGHWSDAAVQHTRSMSDVLGKLSLKQWVLPLLAVTVEACSTLPAPTL